MQINCFVNLSPKIKHVCTLNGGLRHNTIIYLKRVDNLFVFVFWNVNLCSSSPSTQKLPGSLLLNWLNEQTCTLISNQMKTMWVETRCVHLRVFMLIPSECLRLPALDCFGFSHLQPAQSGSWFTSVIALLSSYMSNYLITIAMENTLT